MLTDINQQILTSKSSRENKSGKYTTKYNPMKIELKTMIFLFALINLTDFFLTLILVVRIYQGIYPYDCKL